MFVKWRRKFSREFWRDVCEAIVTLSRGSFARWTIYHGDVDDAWQVSLSRDFAVKRHEAPRREEDLKPSRQKWLVLVAVIITACHAGLLNINCKLN